MNEYERLISIDLARNKLFKVNASFELKLINSNESLRILMGLMGSFTESQIQNGELDGVSSAVLKMITGLAIRDLVSEHLDTYLSFSKRRTDLIVNLNIFLDPNNFHLYDAPRSEFNRKSLPHVSWFDHWKGISDTVTSLSIY